MSKRTSYDDVERESVRWRRDGHDIQLKLKASGDLWVFHNGERVLVDKGRSYDVAFALVRQIGRGGTPELAANEHVIDKDVQLGAKTQKARRKSRAKGATPQ